MAKLTPDATRTEYGLVINQKIIPWGAVWPKNSGKYKKGQKFKADRRLSGGTGKVAGVTIHNTNDLPNVEEDAEQYTRATWPNANMNDARVHYYVDDINAWQNLEDTEVGWHAGDGSGPGNGTTIMGRAEVTAAQMAAFCLSKNAEPRLPSCTVEELASLFLVEGEAEGVRGDVAFAQSLHETGFFKFGGIVQPGQNNYGGLGALNGNSAGQAASFPDPRSGVRAQIQHLKAYASKEPLVNECIDPRFSLVLRGSAEFVEWLGAADNPNGRGWAVPGAGYGGKIVTLLGQIKATEAEEPTPPDDGYPEGAPEWQKEGFEALVERGIINSPDYWKTRFDNTMTAREILAILGRM